MGKLNSGVLALLITIGLFFIVLAAPIIAFVLGILIIVLATLGIGYLVFIILEDHKKSNTEGN